MAAHSSLSNQRTGGKEMSIGQNIAMILQNEKSTRSITLKEFANDLGISRSTLHRYMQDAGNMRLALLDQLSSRLSVSIIDLIGDTKGHISSGAKHNHETPETTAEAYRHPMPVNEVFYYADSLIGPTTYPICPHCGMTMEREFQSFCDRCGQALDWDGLEQAVIRVKMESSD